MDFRVGWPLTCCLCLGCCVNMLNLVIHRIPRWRCPVRNVGLELKGNRLTGRSVSHKREDSALYVCKQLTREKSRRKSGEDMTFGGYLESIRRRCHKKHSQRSGERGEVPGTGRGASVPGPGAGGPSGGTLKESWRASVASR